MTKDQLLEMGSRAVYRKLTDLQQGDNRKRYFAFYKEVVAAIRQFTHEEFLEFTSH